MKTEIRTRVSSLDTVRRSARRARHLLALTQRELAGIVGVSTAAVCSWEHGRVRLAEFNESRLLNLLLLLLADKYHTEEPARGLPIEHLRARLLGCVAMAHLAEAADAVRTMPEGNRAACGGAQ